MKEDVGYRNATVSKNPQLSKFVLGRGRGSCKAKIKLSRKCFQMTFAYNSFFNSFPIHLNVHRALKVLTN